MSIAKLRERGFRETAEIPNGVDTDLFRPHPSPWREANGISSSTFVVLHTARFQAVKNHAMLLRAWQKVIKVHPNALLLLAGEGPLLSPMKAIASELGLDDRVRFLGGVPFANLPDIYAASDLGVMASDYESFCFAILEMMSSGLPVVATSVGWLPNLVSDGAGLLVPPRDSDAFADAILRLATDAPLRRTLGTTARDLVLSRHTWTSSAQKLLSLYQSLLPR